MAARAIDLRNRTAQSAVALISSVDSKPVLIVAVSEKAREQGLKAGALVKIGSTILGGGDSESDRPGRNVSTGRVSERPVSDEADSRLSRTICRVSDPEQS